MRNPFAVLRPQLNQSDAALVLSVHRTLDAAMREQRKQARRYGWAYSEVRRLKVAGKPGDYISRRSHLPHD